MNGQIQIKLMKTNFIFLFLCVCLCAVQNGLWAQGWERSYPLNHSQISNAIDFLPSGNLLLVGTWGDLSGAGASDLGYQYLVVSPDGQLVRHYTYAYPDLVGLPAFITSDGSVLHTENVHQSPNAGWGSELFKIDGQGQREWAFRTPYGEPLFSVTELNNGRYLLPTVRDTLINGQAAQRIGLYCFSTDGQVLWFRADYSTSAYTGGGTLSVMKVIGTRDGGALVSLAYRDGGTWENLLLKVDELGNEQWRTAYGTGFHYTHDIVESSTNAYYVLDETRNQNSRPNTEIQRVDAQGNLEWSKAYDFGNGQYYGELAINPDGTLYLYGGDDGNGIFNFSVQTLRKLSAEGQAIWTRRFSNRDLYFGVFFNHLVSAADGGAYLLSSKYSALRDLDDLYLIRTDSSGVSLTNAVAATVFADSVTNCTYDNMELRLQNWIVLLEGQGLELYDITDANGEVLLPAQSGDFTVSTIPFSPYWSSCQTEYPVSFPANDSVTIAVDIPMQAEVSCPYLEVSLVGSPTAICDSATYTVQYCNLGTAPAIGAYLELELDSLLHFQSATFPHTFANGVYTFDLGDLGLNTCGSFQVDYQVDCAAPPGLTFCTEVHIYPDSFCLPSPNWSGASVEVDGECTGPDINFTIQNTGTAAISSPVSYLVVEDDVILLQGQVNELLPGEVFPLTPIPALGQTYRLEAEQEPFHPGSNALSTAVEACGPGPYSTGYINRFPQNDGNPFVDIECSLTYENAPPNTNSLDGQPLGITENHLIPADQDIEYIIRFQNDAEVAVTHLTIRDTLSTSLDISSIRPGAASHPYTFDLSAGGVLSFHMEGLQLESARSGEGLSGGFVKFRIGQKSDLPKGTQIENQVAIYLGDQAAVFTNTTQHTVGEYPLKVVMNTTDAGELAPSLLRIHPNPMREETIVEWSNYSEGKEWRLKVYDATGQLLRVESITAAATVFRRQDLPRGIYLLQLTDGTRTLANERLIILQ